MMEKRGAKMPRDSSESEESHTSRKEWLRNFSTMKVSPPRHIKHAAKLR